MKNRRKKKGKEPGGDIYIYRERRTGRNREREIITSEIYIKKRTH